MTELDKATDNDGLKRDSKGRFLKGNAGGGSKPDTQEQKLMKVAVKTIIAKYEEGLADALPEIQPKLIALAKDGDMRAITEIHKVLGAHKGEVKNTATMVQINFEKAREDYE